METTPKIRYHPPRPEQEPEYAPLCYVCTVGHRPNRRSSLLFNARFFASACSPLQWPP